jgi:hypothetical protein
MDEERAVWATLVVAVVALAIWGGLSVHQRGGSRVRIAGAALASALIGVVIILLKSWH